ncbi:FadR/GntR family transcriptional regulator [Mesorhizobium sp. CAU 1732]|uniref:FadR/GntR family transcriptional regulator n=1 Tax=Mesorhizobium sp. CAU 1732 TaxID=3140358 RepID=UPI0032602B8C
MFDDDTVERAPRLSEVVARRLGAAIRTGDFAPGQKLPTEKELAERYDVSRMVVREAMSRLRSEGLIDSRQGLGAFVAAEPGKALFRLDEAAEAHGNLRHVFQLRIAVEGTAARLAAINSDACNHEEMRSALLLLKEAIASGRDGTGDDSNFHLAIARASGNPYILRFLAFLGANLREAIAQARSNTAARLPERVMLVEAEHEAVLAAIVEGDAPGAEQAMRQHLCSAMERLGLGSFSALEQR